MRLFDRQAIHYEREMPARDTVSVEIPQGPIYDSEYPKYFNTLQPDGRVNSGRDSDGQVLAISIPPRIPNFIQNIDPPIRELVQALVDKNYLPISSCAGHILLDLRFVSLCFVCLSDAEEIASVLRSVSGITTTIKTSSCNIKVRKIRNELSLSICNTSGGQEIKQEHAYLNYFFKRNSQSWVYLDVNVGDRYYERDGSVKKEGPFKDIWRLLKRAFWSLCKERVTVNLVALIKSDRFPFYQG